MVAAKANAGCIFTSAFTSIISVCSAIDYYIITLCVFILLFVCVVLVLYNTLLLYELPLLPFVKVNCFCFFVFLVYVVPLKYYKISVFVFVDGGCFEFLIIYALLFNITVLPLIDAIAAAVAAIYVYMYVCIYDLTYILYMYV